MSEVIDKDAEIERLKKIIHTAHFALLTCRAYCAGQTTLQQFNAEKIRKAIVLTEEIAVEKTVEDLDNLLIRKKVKNQNEKQTTH